MWTFLANQLFASPRKQHVDAEQLQRKIEEELHAEVEENDEQIARKEDANDLVRMGIITSVEEQYLSIDWKYWCDINLVNRLHCQKHAIKVNQRIKFRLEMSVHGGYIVTEILEIAIEDWHVSKDMQSVVNRMVRECDTINKMLNEKELPVPTGQLIAANRILRLMADDKSKSGGETNSQPPSGEPNVEPAIEPGPPRPRMEARITAKNGVGSNCDVDVEDCESFAMDIPGEVSRVSHTCVEIETESHLIELQPDDYGIDYQLAEHDQVLCGCTVLRIEDFDTFTDDVSKVLTLVPGNPPEQKRCSVKAVRVDHGELSDGQTFFLRSLALNAAGGTAAELVVGDEVEVEAVPNSKEGFRWRCIRIKKVVTGGEAAAKKNPTSRKYGQNIRKATELVRHREQQVDAKTVVMPDDTRAPRRNFVAKRVGRWEVPPRLQSDYLALKERQLRANEFEARHPLLTEELSHDNYVQRFEVLVHLEELEEFIAIRSYDQAETLLVRDKGGAIAMYIENLAERRPSLAIGDSVEVRALGLDAQNMAPFCGYIQKVLADRIHLRFHSAFESNVNNRLFSAKFSHSRMRYRLQHHAVYTAWQQLGREFIFPTEMRTTASPRLDLELNAAGQLRDLDSGVTYSWFQADLNIIQKRAVLRVLRRDADSLPYIIYGPPGTGKTKTNVEIILQMRRLMPQMPLLVATPSNSSANLIATRLLQLRAPEANEFLRVISYNVYEGDSTPVHLAQYCAVVDKGVDNSCGNQNVLDERGIMMHATKGYIEKFRIIVATCSAMGGLLQLDFQRSHFPFVLIDEAGQCTEPESMMPVALLGRRGQVVLTGDPNQLEPNVNNVFAETKGLGRSLMQRLLSHPMYRKDKQAFAETHGYNPLLVTKLVYNYRSLPSVLQIYSDLFYHSELCAMLDEYTSDEACLLRSLGPMPAVKPSKVRPPGHGVFFYGVNGQHKQLEDSPSWYNPAEAQQVLNVTQYLFKKGVTADQIGIITPYLRQSKHLHEIFDTIGVASPKIGTVHEFQGQERQIILISAVRSAAAYDGAQLRQTMGFMRNWRLLNVSISRARCLVIMFGNPVHLSKNPHWSYFIKYCIEHDAYAGMELPKHLQYPLKVPRSGETPAEDGDEGVDLASLEESLKGDVLERMFGPQVANDEVSVRVRVPRSY